MIHIPILRHGKPYLSVETAMLLHHATGEPVAELSLANSGLIGRDMRRLDATVLERIPIAELTAMSRKAADLFLSARLPLGDANQSFDEYVASLSATTGMPISYCRSNAEKIAYVLREIEDVLAGLTRGLDLSILDRGFGKLEGRTVSFFREGRILGAVLPSNSPGVHSLWIPAIPLKAPIVLKPGREEPWTPFRVIEALAAAGVPREAFGFYPTDHAGAGELMRLADRAMIFGDAATTRPWHHNPRVEVHGPGFSKILLGDDAADDWPKYLDVIASSIEANCGRSCINASGVWTPRHGAEIAEALAARFASIPALPADHAEARVAAFANPAMAERISAVIDHDLLVPGAEDVTQRLRGGDSRRAGSNRLVRQGRCAWLLPTVVRCDDREHPLANREFLFPFASVVECPTVEMPSAIGSSLIVTAITDEPVFRGRLMASPNIDRLNFGPIPTWRISWNQPHEGNLFEHLYRQRAFQMEGAA
ncbi:MAG: aldehyde dehydrogenase [Phycisphaerales bacterium]|nr:aldehyde dehydrogenase [Phycisphaerales bacterium]